jgi:hypothetical protein
MIERGDILNPVTKASRERLVQIQKPVLRIVEGHGDRRGVENGGESPCAFLI